MRYVLKVQAACQPEGAPATGRSRGPMINDHFVLRIGGEEILQGTVIKVEPKPGVITVGRAKVMNAFEVYDGNLKLVGDTWILEPEPECF